MSTQKPLRKIYRESEDETARLGVTKRETRKMLRELEDEINYLESMEVEEKLETYYVPKGYSGFPDSIFLFGRIFMIMLLALLIPFLFVATKETLPVATLVIMFFALNEGIIRLFGWKI